MNGKVLIVEDEPRIADAIRYALQREGVVVELIDRGDEAVRGIERFAPDVLILDVMLPGLDGLEILKKLPSARPFGVIMLTAKGDIIDKVLGLELGADDYMTKPFDMRELLARVKSLLRRKPAEGVPAGPSIRLGELELDLGEHSASAAGTRLELTPKEYDLLALLLSTPNRVYTREQLLQLIWGMDYFGGTRTVDIHIQRLRKKLGPAHAAHIQTVHGIGYKAIGGGLEHQR